MLAFFRLALRRYGGGAGVETRLVAALGRNASGETAVRTRERRANNRASLARRLRNPWAIQPMIAARFSRSRLRLHPRRVRG